MRIRKYAAEQGLAEAEALNCGLEQKATELTESGAEIYAKT
jgi:phosphomethylpyrimidine synthase